MSFILEPNDAGMPRIIVEVTAERDGGEHDGRKDPVVVLFVGETPDGKEVEYLITEPASIRECFADMRAAEADYNRLVADGT